MGMEGFDGIGIEGTTEAGRALDLSGDIVDFETDGRFVGPADLGRKLRTSATMQKCVVRQWFRFTMGRAEVAGSGDDCSVQTAALRFEASGFKSTELLMALVETDAFLYRKGGDR